MAIHTRVVDLNDEDFLLDTYRNKSASYIKRQRAGGNDAKRDDVRHIATYHIMKDVGQNERGFGLPCDKWTNERLMRTICPDMKLIGIERCADLYPRIIDNMPKNDVTGVRHMILRSGHTKLRYSCDDSQDVILLHGNLINVLNSLTTLIQKEPSMAAHFAATFGSWTRGWLDLCCQLSREYVAVLEAVHDCLASDRKIIPMAFTVQCSREPEDFQKDWDVDFSHEKKYMTKREKHGARMARVVLFNSIMADICATKEFKWHPEGHHFFQSGTPWMALLMGTFQRA